MHINIRKLHELFSRNFIKYFLHFFTLFYMALSGVVEVVKFIITFQIHSCSLKSRNLKRFHVVKVLTVAWINKVWSILLGVEQSMLTCCCRFHTHTYYLHTHTHTLSHPDAVNCVCHAGSAALLLFLLQFCRFVITSSALIKAHPVIRFYVESSPPYPTFFLSLTDEYPL